MGSTDFGTQTQSFDFNMEASSEDFNKINYQLHQPGLYSGGTLSKFDATTVRIAPLTCYIDDNGSAGNGVRITTTLNFDLAVAEATPYIILRFAWNNVTANYMDIFAVAFGSIQADDIIIGKATYISSVLQTTFDYTRQTTGYVTTLAAKELELHVQSNNPIDNTVYVNGGTIRGQGGVVTVSSGASPTLSTTSSGRIDLIYIDENGDIQVQTGVDSGTPSIPDFEGRYVVAIITRGASRSVIDGNEITQVNPIGDMSLYELSLTSSGNGASLIGVRDIAGHFTQDNVETVLAEIITNLASTINGLGASLIGIYDLASNFSGATVEAALAEIAAGTGLFSSIDMSGTLTVDIIDEYTGSAGVTIENVLIKANVITATTVNALIGTATQGTINHDSLANYASNRHRQVFVQSGTPGSPATGDLWIDTT